MRKLGVLLVAGVLFFSAVSCTTKKSEDVSTASSSTEASSNDNGGETSNSNKSTSTTEGGSSDPDSNDETALGNCAAISAVAASLSLGAAFATDDQKAELKEQMDELRSKVPSELQDDMDTISEGADNADGIVELGQFLDSDEYRDAMANIQQYLADNCDASDLLPE